MRKSLGITLGLLTLLATLATLAYAFSWTVTLYPDYIDSLGIGNEAYRGTCFTRTEPADGYVVICDANQRLGKTTGTPVDCATFPRHAKATLNPVTGVYEFRTPRPHLPLPNNSALWKLASTGWCPPVKRADTNEVVWPGCHAENYQQMNLVTNGPRDTECEYASIPIGVNFTYQPIALLPPVCGNGIFEEGEQCDPPGDPDKCMGLHGGACSATCTCP